MNKKLSLADLVRVETTFFIVTMTFPRLNQTSDWVKFLNVFPELEEMTMCFWMKANDLNGFPISYHHTKSSNAFHLEIRSDEVMIRINGRKYNIKLFDLARDEQVIDVLYLPIQRLIC